MMFIGLIYSAGMPLLYVAIFLYLFFTYWTDKYLSNFI